MLKPDAQEYIKSKGVNLIQDDYHLKGHTHISCSYYDKDKDAFTAAYEEAKAELKEHDGIVWWSYMTPTIGWMNCNSFDQICEAGITLDVVYRGTWIQINCTKEEKDKISDILEFRGSRCPGCISDSNLCDCFLDKEHEEDAATREARWAEEEFEQRKRENELKADLHLDKVIDAEETAKVAKIDKAVQQTLKVLPKETKPPKPWWKKARRHSF